MSERLHYVKKIVYYYANSILEVIMSIFNRLLFISFEVSEEVIDLVKIITICAIAALILIMFILHRTKSTMDTRATVFAAISIALSFVLSFIKFPLPFLRFGGSVTLASFVPIIIYSYFYGPVRGLLAGIVYGLLQFIQDSWFLTPVQFILDYVLAFASIALAGVYKKILPEKAAVLVGAASVGLARLIMHILAGIIFFNAGFVYEGLPTSSALLYSTLYNVTYVVPDILISIGVIAFMLYGNYFKSIGDIMKKKQ